MMTHEESLICLDREWYLTRYSDVADSGTDPDHHYRSHGQREGRFPNARAEGILLAEAFDRKWYSDFYPDVSQTGWEAADHYLTIGRLEKRFTNAEAFRLAELTALFDPIWYINRNRDVAKSGMDPLRHFLMYGHKEHRSPHGRLEARARWRGWFDPNWYTARYADVPVSGLSPIEHYLRIGIYSSRSPNTVDEDRSAWKTVFDDVWYADRYSDIATSGLSPLEHFIKYGIVSHRKPNAAATLAHEAVERAAIEPLKSSPLSDHVALFVTHTAAPRLKPHVAHHLRAFKRASISVVLIVATDLPSLEIDPEIASIASVVLKRQNRGFDFAAWAHIFKMDRSLFQKKMLILCNDSTFGPFGFEKFDNLIRSVNDSDADIVGLTDNTEFGWHLQSYFLVLKETALRSEAFIDFMESVVSYKSKDVVIYEYETQFSQKMIDRGLACEAIYKSSDSTNATFYKWRELIENGFPYLKASILQRPAVSLNILGWRETLQDVGYDPRVADQSLADISLLASNDRHIDFSCGMISQRNAIHNLHRFFATGARISVADTSDPELSIVVLMRNRAEFLYPLLQHFQTHDFPRSVELIVVDVGSSDETLNLLSRVDGLRVVSLPPHTDPGAIADEIRSVVHSSTLMLLNNPLYLHQAAIKCALRCEHLLKPGTIMSGPVEINNTFYAEPFPSLSRMPEQEFVNLDGCVFEFAGDDPLDYLFLIRRDDFTTLTTEHTDPRSATTLGSWLRSHVERSFTSLEYANGLTAHAV